MCRQAISKQTSSLKFVKTFNRFIAAAGLELLIQSMSMCFFQLTILGTNSLNSDDVLLSNKQTLSF